ncbi:hypothetical protein [Clostridium sp.]|uniref:hypothetical protein n=1 Tax=Clostridium sp. TaxID=1506 RepID=UPI00262054D4|nr:hypothetical protein [Clostridium sp.]
MRVTLNVNSTLLNDFYKTCDYLHKVKRQNCFYNKSSAFQYIIKEFNQDVEDVGLNIAYNSLEPYNDKIKKDFELGISIDDYYYKKFHKNFTHLETSFPKLIRLLMWNLILNTKIE